MTIIEIIPLDNGAHRNQTIDGQIAVPEGWAEIPAGMAVPETFPFVDIEVEGNVVVKMTAGTVPEPEPETTPEPTQLDRIEAQATYTAMMTDTLMEG